MYPNLMFNVEAAKEYGINQAVTMELISTWVDYFRIMYDGDNKSLISEQVFYEEDRYWVSSSFSSLHSYLCYLTEDEFDDLMNDCTDNDLIRFWSRLGDGEKNWDLNKIWISLGDSCPYSYLNKFHKNGTRSS